MRQITHYIAAAALALPCCFAATGCDDGAEVEVEDEGPIEDAIDGDGRSGGGLEVDVDE